jgi:hypothetical protein
MTDSTPMHVPLLQAYQVFKARASGADAILLIAAVLPNSDMNYLIKSARSVGLQCLIEVGSREGLDAVAFPGQLARPVGALMRRRQSPRKLARSVMPTPCLPPAGAYGRRAGAHAAPGELGWLHAGNQQPRPSGASGVLAPSIWQLNWHGTMLTTLVGLYADLQD